MGDSGFIVDSCSICLEKVKDNLVRTWVKLQCGHEFHLGCIGSAFNFKGIMQCPNCQNIETGLWLYSNPPNFGRIMNGLGSVGDRSIGDWSSIGEPSLPGIWGANRAAWLRAERAEAQPALPSSWGEPGLPRKWVEAQPEGVRDQLEAILVEEFRATQSCWE